MSARAPRSTPSRPSLAALALCGLQLALACTARAQPARGSDGPLGEWPDFEPIGYITAPHPDIPDEQTHLYGDWGGIVGEEFIVLEGGLVKLLYHSYHETYMTEHVHEEEVLHDWALGYDAETKIKFPPLARPGGPIPGPAWEHTDTPAYIRHPRSGAHLLYNTVRPGTKHLHPEWEGLPGHESAIQVATSEDPPAIGVPFDQSYDNALVAELWWEQGWNQEGVVRGGLSEPTPVWVPHLGTHGKVRLFYRGLHGAPGTYWNWRISYADSDDGMTGWVKNPVPTFDPSDPENPAHRWTQPPPVGFGFRGAWQAHCTGDTIAGGVHMILTVSNQNVAGFGHLAYYWSPDWGDTWYGHPDNPIIAPGQFEHGVPASGFQRTPTLLVDDTYGRYIIAYNAGHDTQEPWRRRTYLAVASRPGGSTRATAPPVGAGATFRLLRIAPNPAPGAVRLDLDLPRAGGLDVAIYAATGRLVGRLERLRAAAGRRSLSWNATAAGHPLPAGIYFLHARLESPAGGVDVATGRVVLNH
ncbi:MAG: hypothetical protein PVF43_15130 [Candidatus Eiseniibacteriota bacterium]|jgi:hypothetical protein